MISCNKCGKPIEGNEERCPHCGNKIEAKEIYKQWNEEQMEFTVEKEGGNSKLYIIIGSVIFIGLAIFIGIYMSKASSKNDDKKPVANINDNYTSGMGIKEEEPKKDEVKVEEEKPLEGEQSSDGKENEKKDDKQDIVMKYKTVGNKNILETIYKAQVTVTQIITSVNTEGEVEKKDTGVEYIQLSENFNTKSKVKAVLSQYVSGKEVDGILSQDVFMEKQGKLYVIYGNISPSMDILKSSVIERKETEQGIKIKINGNDVEGENQTIEGEVTMENDKLVVSKWKFF